MVPDSSFVASLNWVAVLYFVFFVLTLVMGVYVFTSNRAAPTARVFLALSLSFAFLHLGELFFSWSSAKADAFFFTAVRSIGFVTWFPLLLHLFLLQRHERLPRGWQVVLGLFYAYSAVLVAGNLTGHIRSADFVREGIVWIDVPHWAPVTWGYLVMMPFCLVVSLAIMFRLRHEAGRSGNIPVQRQMTIMGVSGIPLALIGNYFNIVAPALGIRVPAVGHLFAGIWLLVLGYAISRYRFLVPTLEFASSQIFAIAGEIILITDMDDKIIECNQAFGRQLGYGPAERPELRRLVLDHLPPPRVQPGEVLPVLPERLVQVLRRDGSQMHAKMVANYLVDRGIPMGIVYVLSDVTELKCHNERLEQAVQERTRELQQASDEAERRLKITQIYTRKSIVDCIEQGKDPTAFAPERKSISILFSDVRDFTAISEPLAPLDTVNLLNTYFNEMNSCIHRLDGEIDKLIGDCIMALFKAPDHAIRAAIQMREKLQTINLQKKTVIRINNGIGINHGEVVMGNIGSTGKMDYTVIGDIVNSASRLESLTKHYRLGIIIAEELKQQLAHPYAMRFIDTVLVKGKKNPIKLYEVYDYEHESVRELKVGLGPELADAWDAYRHGDFAVALAIYRQARTKAGPHRYLDGVCKDPLLDFYIQRCGDLLERQERGLLREWNGIHEFMDK